MKHQAGSVLVVALSFVSANAIAQPFPDDGGVPDDTTVARRAPQAEPPFRPTPILKLSYARWSLGNNNGAEIPLEALHLDTFSLSRPWVRLGFSAEVGRGGTSFGGAAASVRYGLLGVDLGVQIPGRITPFLQGHLAGGVLSPKLDGTLSVPGTGVSVTGASAATWIYTRGLEVGFELHPLGPFLAWTSVGWISSTWQSADYQAIVKSQTLELEAVTHDSVLFKMGVGF
jgi:hypothetical protein